MLYASIQQVNFEPRAEGITGAAVAASSGGVWPGAREPFFLKRTVPFIYTALTTPSANRRTPLLFLLTSDRRGKFVAGSFY
jgi:hypothetical protein